MGEPANCKFIKCTLSDWTVVQTRTDQTTYISPENRSLVADDYIYDEGAVIFVSIHHNGSDNHNAQGTETLWCEFNLTYGATEAEKRALADALQPELVNAFGYTDRGVKEDYVAREIHFTVLENTLVISAITEASFIDTEAEEDLMANDVNHRIAEATAIKNGVGNYAATVGIDENFCVLPPGTPANLSEYDQVFNGLTIYWDEANNASYYEIHRSTTQGFNPSSQTLIGTTSNTIYFDEDLPQPFQYYYILLSVSDCGGGYNLFSNYSSELSVYFDPSPAPPDNLRLRQYRHRHGFQWVSHPKLTWYTNQEADMANYKVYRKLNSGNWSNISTTSSTIYIDHTITIVSGGPENIYYRVTAVDLVPQESPPSEIVNTTTEWQSKNTVANNSVPNIYSINQNFPNPFNATTEILFGLPEDSYVSFVIYDLLGREIFKLVSNQEMAGNKSVLWDGKDYRGNSVSSGMYIYRLEAKSLNTNEYFIQTRKMLLLR